jgi:hypothetical protein
MFMPRNTLLILATVLVASTPLSTTGAREWFVSTSSTLGGDGSITAPYDPISIFYRPVQPGDTVWYRGGTYRIDVNGASLRYVGTETQPIIVRNYRHERVVIEQDGTTTITGSHLWIWGFEFTSNPAVLTRHSRQSGSSPSDIYGGGGCGIVSGVGNKFINCVVHDNARGGFFIWNPATDAELHGNLVYYNGWLGTDRTHGQGLYAQNALDSTARKDNKVYNNIFFVNACHGTQIYGSSKASIECYDVQENLYFDNAILFGKPSGANFLIGGGRVAHNERVIGNDIYRSEFPSPSAPSGDFYFGFGEESSLTDSMARNNYIVGNAYCASPFVDVTLESNTFMGDVYFGPLTGKNRASYPQNRYTEKPTSGKRVVVRPNKYESGRAHIIIYNWGKASSVDVDMAGVGFVAGDEYELHNVQDYFRDITTGTYDGGTISVPMTGHTVAKPVGIERSIPSTFPEFGAFVIMKKVGVVLVHQSGGALGR